MSRTVPGSDDIDWRSALEITALVRSKQLSPVELTERVLARIERLNPQLNAFCLVAADTARRAAREKGTAGLDGREPQGRPHAATRSMARPRSSRLNGFLITTLSL